MPDSEQVSEDRIPNPPRCMMPECDGGEDLKLVEDPSDNILWMCQDCRSEGWPVRTVNTETAQDGGSQ